MSLKPFFSFFFFDKYSSPLLSPTNYFNLEIARVQDQSFQGFFKPKNSSELKIIGVKEYTVPKPNN